VADVLDISGRVEAKQKQHWKGVIPVFGRPWRWLIAALVAVIIIGVVNSIVLALDGPEYLGLGAPGRAAVFLVMATGLSVFVLPSQAKLDSGKEPLPPLPDSISMQGQRRNSA
jgi:hypothetical protein